MNTTYNLHKKKVNPISSFIKPTYDKNLFSKH